MRRGTQLACPRCPSHEGKTKVLCEPGLPFVCPCADCSRRYAKSFPPPSMIIPIILTTYILLWIGVGSFIFFMFFGIPKILLWKKNKEGGFSFQVSYNCPNCHTELFIDNCFKKIDTPTEMCCGGCNDSYLMIHLDNGALHECTLTGAKPGRVPLSI